MRKLLRKLLLLGCFPYHKYDALKATATRKLFLFWDNYYVHIQASGLAAASKDEGPKSYIHDVISGKVIVEILFSSGSCPTGLRDQDPGLVTLRQRGSSKELKWQLY